MSDPREDFPLLAERRFHGRPIVYLDAGATSLQPRAVIDAQVRFASTIGASVHRSHHLLGDEATFAFAQARRRVARFLGADPSSVVFTSGATAALNMVARGLRLGAAARVLVSRNDHHSNILPWSTLGGVVYFDSDPRLPVDPERFERELGAHRPGLVALSHASNVTGVVHPVAELCRLARSYGALSVVDVSQTVAHRALNVDALGADFIAFSGHKVFGPFGTGVLWGKRESLESLQPLLLGGGSVHRVTEQEVELAGVPERLEAGTPNITGVIGLAAALDYLEGFGWEQLMTHETALADALEHELELTPRIRRLMASRPERIALGSFASEVPELPNERIAALLGDTESMLVRVGRLCAHPLFERESLPSAIRVSTSIYNSVEEIARLGRALRRLLARFDR